MRGHLLHRISPAQYLYYMNLAVLSLSVMPVGVPEISADLMSRGGLRAKVHCSVQDYVTWMQSLDVMTVWWQNLQMQ